MEKTFDDRKWIAFSRPPRERNGRAFIASSVFLTLLFAIGLFTVPAQGASCSPGSGPNACSPGSTRCFDERSVQTCGSDSCVWDKILPCKNTELCLDGSCVLNPAFAPLFKKQKPAAAPPATPAPVKPAATKTPSAASASEKSRARKAECRPGATETQPCNPNDCPTTGTQSRSCRNNGRWGRWSDCRGCAGSQCADGSELETCTDQCTWTRKACGDFQDCVDGSCVRVGAQFIEKERLAATGRLRQAPMLRRNGNPISSERDLAAALASGEIVLYSGRQELSLVENPGSAWARFTTVQAKGTAQGNFLSIVADECRLIGTSVMGRFVRLDQASPKYENLVGKIFRISYDYFDGCADCWGGGPCFGVQSKKIVRSGTINSHVKGWQWSLFDYRAVFGTQPGLNEIAIDPATGKITGLTDARISYYHGGTP